MIERSPTFQPDKVRVSIFERIVPFFGFVVAALGSGFGSWYLYSFIAKRLVDRSLGIEMLGHHVIGSTTIALISLYVSTFLIFIGIIISATRLCTACSKASPLGVSHLVFGILSLAPAAMLWFGATFIIGIYDPVNPSGEFGFARKSRDFSLTAMIVAPIAAFLIAIWALIPFRSIPGRRYGPLVSLLLVEALFLIAVVLYQWRLLWLLENVKT